MKIKNIFLMSLLLVGTLGAGTKVNAMKNPINKLSTQKLEQQGKAYSEAGKILDKYIRDAKRGYTLHNTVKRGRVVHFVPYRLTHYADAFNEIFFEEAKKEEENN